jgi:hypothetical protein
MVAIIYDDLVERFGPLLVEGRVYYVGRMSAEPVMRNLDYRFADSHCVVCFTSQTVVSEVRTVGDELIPLFPPFMPLDRVWQFTMGTNMCVGKCLILFLSFISAMLKLNNTPSNGHLCPNLRCYWDGFVCKFCGI